MDKGKNRRKLRNILIDKDLQLRFVVSSLLFMLFTVVVAFAVIFLPLIKEMFSADSEIQYRAARDFLVLIKRLVPTVLVLVFLFAFYLLVVTHRIFGPLMKFRRTFTLIGTGNLRDTITIRKGDYLFRECDSVNEMIDSLSRLLKELADKQRKVCCALKDALSTSKDATLAGILHEAEEVCRGLEEFSRREDIPGG